MKKQERPQERDRKKERDKRRAGEQSPKQTNPAFPLPAGGFLRRFSGFWSCCMAGLLFPCLLAVFCAPALSEQRASLPFDQGLARSALVKINWGNRSASGFATSENTVVTAAGLFYPFDSKEPIYIQTADGEQILSERVKQFSFLSNLAILETASPLRSSLELGAFPAKGIYVLGDSEQWLQKAEGTETKSMDNGNLFYYFLSNLAIKENNQGAGYPVFNKEGKVIGVVSRAYGNSFHIVSVSALQNLLSRPPIPGEGTDMLIQRDFAGLKTRAEEGNLEAQYRLGVLLSSSKWLEAAANKGHVKAQLYLGILLIMEGQAQYAFKWLQKAAEQGHPDAQNGLAGMFYRGEGVWQDNKKAFEHYKKAAEQGHITAQTILGIMLLEGEGGEKNLKQARQWLEAGAAKGDPLAIVYLDSLPAPPDLEEAWQHPEIFVFKSSDGGSRDSAAPRGEMAEKIAARKNGGENGRKNGEAPDLSGPLSDPLGGPLSGPEQTDSAADSAGDRQRDSLALRQASRAHHTPDQIQGPPRQREKKPSLKPKNAIGTSDRRCLPFIFHKIH